MGIEIDGVNNKIDLDDDKDTSISSASDDTLVVEVGGNTLATLTENKFTINDNLTVTTADTTDTLILQSTDAGASAGPHLILDRGSASPAADDLLGRISYRSRNSAGEQIDLVKTSCFISDATDGSEDTQFEIDQRVAGTFRNFLTMFAGGIVFNEDNQDINLRVEGSNNVNLLFTDAGVDSVYINASAQITDEKFLVNNNDNSKGLISRCTSGSQANDTVHFDANRAGTSAYNFVRIQSGNFSDSEFIISGQGDVNADGSFNGGGADYAEFFEWEDGNTSDEDRVGCSVVLDGNKIVKATDSDDPSKIIGVISANPAVTGDSDIEQWLHKYERDELNRFIWEDYESVIWYDENGKDTFYHLDRVPEDVTIPDDATYYRTEDDGITKLKRKKLNPNWDSSQTYVSRKDRKEWDTVGLMGKLRLKKGQPTGTNWIKMRDISETVEEWLVR